jgi:Ca2+-binding RTX toxin-like protein
MVQFVKSDLAFILEQIKISEAHASGQDLNSLLPNPFLPWGLRTVDGSMNNLLAGQEQFGAADNPFPRMTTPSYLNDADGDQMPLGPFPAPVITNNDYGVNGSVADADPRIISNLIVDQTASNPAAVAASGTGNIDPFGNLDIPNVAPDEGLSAPFNSWMTLFGQFFDHGLDLVTKGGNGTVYIPLQPDDPLYVEGGQTNFMVLTRATPTMVDPDGDGPLPAAPQHENTTTSWVDQNQTYTSHASHQVFLREYVLNGDGDAVATGKMLEGANGGLANWAEVKAQALEMLGINLNDFDVHNVPLLRTDQYGKFIPGPNGYAQMVMAPDATHPEPWFKEGTAIGITTEGSIGTGHAFLNDIAHHATPGFVDHDHNPMTPKLQQTADLDPGTGDDGNPLTYDDELLDAHFITGDGRGNENIGLTSVHFIFHAEHNRLVEQTKEVILASNDPAFIAEWQLPDGSWNGERLFQAARFGTEMQYQHLVFEEFARKVQPNIDVFLGYDATIDPSIVAEFAHTVYRFGHSMLTETIDRYDASFNADHIGLIEGFLNPVEFAEGAASQTDMAGMVIRGMTRQAGNEIDEFVVEALRNNLLGLPLDLATINLARGRETGVATLNEARREFYAGTGDSQLKPYESWVDFAMHAKNEMSVVNFIAAYGTHADLLLADVDTAVDKRAVAWSLVTGQTVLINEGEPDERAYTADENDRLDYLNSQGAYVNEADGRTVTGVDAIDLWIGGLAEAKMPFGGLLGSTFNFVFETQMEALQNGDRFYYLNRNLGLNFFTELEQNSFAGIIERNTGLTHLPGDVFSTPTYQLEVDQTKQFNLGLVDDGDNDGNDDDGIEGNDDPLGESIFTPLVVRNNPATPGTDDNYLRFTGGDHVVLGGTEGNDILIAGLGDDTLWGDGGNDRLEGGAGNDILIGGEGDDIIQDSFGDDNLQGLAGNDVINAGQGLDLILGGTGIDFIVGGEDLKEIFGGQGGDFILSGDSDDEFLGNEGDDWMEGGNGHDALVGDNGNPFGEGDVNGNDVMIGGPGDDDYDGETGDDIFVAGAGVERMEGMLGFDWTTYRDETTGIEVDMNTEVFTPPHIPPSPNSFLDRFGEVEGLSGTQFSDILRGDDAVAADLVGHELRNFDLIDGLKNGPNALFNEGVVEFASGNILLGGAGSDTIEGRGGDDIIDGDAYLNVYLSIRDANDPDLELFTADSLSEFQEQMFAGLINPSQIKIMREILTSATPDFDTAVFSDVISNYVIEGGGVDENGDGYITISHNDPVLGVGLGIDGVDRVRNIERLQFADDTIVLSGSNAAPVGLLTLSTDAPTEDQPLTVSALGVTDGDNVSPGNPSGAITGSVQYFWQIETAPGVFEDIEREFFGEVFKATGPTFVPGDAESDAVLRVRALYLDGHGVIEEVFSAPTQPVINVNDAPVGALLIGDMTPAEDQLLVAINAFADADGTAGAVFEYQWQEWDGANWSDIAGAITEFLAPDQAQVGKQLRVTVTYTDDGDTTETLTSAATAAVTNVNDPPVGAIQIDDSSPTETLTLTALVETISDEDGTTTSTFDVQWMVHNGTTWVNIDGATDLTFTPSQDEVNKPVKVVVNYTDDFGAAETIESEPTIVTGDYIFDSNAGNTLNGTAGQDIIFGNGGNDTINGGDENDLLDGGEGNDTVNGGAGDDTIDFRMGDESDTINGGADFDTVRLRGTNNNDTLNVRFSGGVLNSIPGLTVAAIEAFEAHLEDGEDTLSYDPPGALITTTGVSVDLAAGTATGFAAISGIEHVTGGSGSDTFAGDEHNNTFTGGNGNDTYTLAGTLEGAIITTGSATSAAAGTDTLNSIENYVGSQGDDTIVVNGGSNLIDGQGGNDTLDAGGGSDTVLGGAGDDHILYAIGNGTDTMDGGDDEDTLTITGTAAANTLSVLFLNGSLVSVAGGLVSNIEHVELDLLAGNDTLNYGLSLSGVTVNLTTGTASGFDTIAGVENVTGGLADDVITGGAGVNSLNGSTGNDRFVAVAGDGNDSINGGIGTDTYDLSGTTAGATVTTTNATSAQIGNDTLNSIENIIGSQGNDNINVNGSANTIDGQAGNDTINAGGGVDIITGGAGNDNITGGTGNDIIRFALGFDDDTIVGFDSDATGGQDRLSLGASLGINAGNFGANVSIAAQGANTLITIGGDTITLLGVAAATVTIDDFAFGL